MAYEHRPGDFLEAVTRAITVGFGVPIVGVLVGGAGMTVASLLGIPLYLFYWQGPEDFIVDHFGVSF